MNWEKVTIDISIGNLNELSGSKIESNTFNDCKASFSGTRIDFSISSFDANNNQELKLILFQSEGGRLEKQISTSSLLINQFVIGYKYDRKKYHKCTVSFGKDYSLEYDLCV